MGESPHEANQSVLMELLIVVLPYRHFDGRIDEEGAENEEHPGETRDQSGTDENKQPAKHQCNRYANRENELLQFLRHREVRHDDDEHEEVVDAE